MSTRIKVKIITNARNNEVCGLIGEFIKVKIKAKPINGKANAYLIKYLSKKLSVSQSDIFIESGKLSREKTLEINNIEKDEIYKILGISQGEP